MNIQDLDEFLHIDTSGENDNIKNQNKINK